MKYERIKENLFYLFVCAETCKTEEELAALEAAVKSGELCGTERGWMMAKDRDDFCIQCANDPSRSHYVFAA